VSGMRICRKVWYSRTGHRWQYNAAHAFLWRINKAQMRKRIIYYTYCFYTTRLVMLKHLGSKCIACLVIWVESINIIEVRLG